MKRLTRPLRPSGGHRGASHAATTPEASSPPRTAPEAVLSSGAPDIHALLLDEARLTLVAQPIVDLRRSCVVGYEALARFSLVEPATPDRVFAMAVRAGLGEELEAMVIRRALQLSRELPPDCFLTVNLDPSHVGSRPVWNALEEQPNLSGVVFELTEHRRIDDLDEARRAMTELKRRGALIAVDDAGSGYSGLRQILDIRPQLLKLDRELITRIHEDEAKRALVQMFGEFAARLDARILAECVESEAELSALRALGIPLAQGNFLGEPAPPWAPIDAAAEEFLTERRSVEASLSSIASLVESSPTCGEEGPWPEHKVCVRTNREGRPIGLRVVDPRGAFERIEHELLRVRPTTSLSDVAYRVATRPEPLRWDPIVCTDEQGKLKGLIHLQRLLSALAERTAPTSLRET